MSLLLAATVSISPSPRAATYTPTRDTLVAEPSDGALTNKCGWEHLQARCDGQFNAYHAKIRPYDMGRMHT